MDKIETAGAFSILTSDRLTATQALALGPAPEGGAFSILTSDRLTATMALWIEDRMGPDFQYPDLGSFDCNNAHPITDARANKRAFSILTSDRLTATKAATEFNDSHTVELSVS